MSSIAAELNALATATTIDFYRRHFKKEGTDTEYVRFGRIADGILGIIRLHCGDLRDEFGFID